MDERKMTKYRGIALTVIYVAFAICLMVFAFNNFSKVWEFMKRIVRALNPFVIGFILCYLVNPLFELVRRPLEKKHVKRSLAKTLASAACILAVCLVIFGIFALIIPKLMESFAGLVSKAPDLIAGYDAWYESVIRKEFAFKDLFIQIMEAIGNYANKFFSDVVTPNLDVIATTVFSSVMSVGKFLYNFIIGLVCMVYLLNYKERLVPAAKRLVYASMPKIADEFCAKMKQFNSIFCGFITGKLLDSLIIGILCFIGCEILRIPFAPLVAVFVGVTNIIPFFGPFIGAIPTGAIILIINPEKFLIFVIFIFALQQLDGNVIGPKILGDSIGITSLSVLFSILVGGSLFGFVGMLLAVPTWAFIKILIDDVLRKRLKRAGLPTEAEDYGPGKHPSPCKEDLDDQQEEGHADIIKEENYG